DEGVQALDRVVEEGPAGDDQQPAAVPHRTPDQAAVGGHLAVVERLAQVVGAEATVAAQVGGGAVQGVGDRMEAEVVEVLGTDREGRGDGLVHHQPFAGGEVVGGGRAQDVGADR